MKISKLFHWLYAVVMLLPVFAIGVTCGYAIFNKNAYQSFASESVEYKSVNESDLYYDKYYVLDVSNKSWNGSVNYLTNSDIKYTNYSGNDFVISNYNRIRFYNTNYIAFFSNTESTIYLNSSSVSTIRFNYTGFTENSSFSSDIVYYELENVNSRNIQDVFYYAVDRVTQSSMFSWAYDSFLVTPFAYIVNLFLMPTNSPVVMLLSYWLTISVIWLVFDLIMYVPLLAHRWLDKGMVE